VPSRPAHRPSRRPLVIDAAIGLFARQPPESITVADIATAAGMTPAAVYYHFPSKEQIVLEGLQAFTAELLAELSHIVADSDEDGWAGTVLVRVLQWLDTRWAPAAVYFAHSFGVDLTIEALRRDVRIETVVLLRRALKSARGSSLTGAEASVVAVALLSVLETAAAAWLTQDAIFQGLGPARFLEETARLGERVVGT
jgi:AcrR family transcriptional regulator